MKGREVEEIAQYFRFYSVPAPSNPNEPWVCMYLFAVFRSNFLQKKKSGNKKVMTKSHSET